MLERYAQTQYLGQECRRRFAVLRLQDRMVEINSHATLLRLDLQALAPSVQRQLTRLVQSQQFEAPHERSDMRVA
jgi:hypothetical protein